MTGEIDYYDGNMYDGNVCKSGGNWRDDATGMTGNCAKVTATRGPTTTPHLMLIKGDELRENAYTGKRNIFRMDSDGFVIKLKLNIIF